MANTFVVDGITYATSLPFPVDMGDRELWGTGQSWPAGVHKAKILGVALQPGNKGGKNAVVLLENTGGPDEKTDYVGLQWRAYFTILSADGSDKPANYFAGFLAQVCPEALKPENLVKTDKGMLPHLKYFVGAEIQLTLEDDEYEGKKKVRMRRGSVKCLRPTPEAVELRSNGKSKANAELAEAEDAFANVAE